MVKVATKKLILTIGFFSMLAVLASGQTVVLQSTNLPNSGDNWVNKTFQDTSAQAGPGGSGVVWDFSLYFVTVNTLTEEYRTPLTSGVDATFSTANLKCDSYFGWTDYYYKNPSGTALQYLGFQNSSNEIRISNTQNLLTIPMSYGASIVNVPLSGTGYLGSTLTGTLSVTADGEGTLKVGGVTYANVLRVKYDFDMVEDFGSGTSSPVHVVKYSWYKSNLRAPIMQMSSLHMSGLVGNSTQKYITVSTVTTGIDNLSKPNLNFSVFPNPLSGQANVQVNIDKSSSVIFNIMDITGRKVKSENYFLAPGDHNVIIDVSTLTKGIYILSASAGTTIRTKRIVIAD